GRRGVDVGVALHTESLDGPRRIAAQRVVVRSIIVNGGIVVGDVGDVYRLGDVGHVLFWRENALAQDRFADVANIDKIVVGRTDVEVDVHPGRDRLLIPIFARAAWRQRRPTHVIPAGA